MEIIQIAPPFDRLRARDQLPKRITETRKRGDALLKAAKGLG